MIPDRLGRYRIVGTLGEGGMGVVYDAVLEGPGGFEKPVALKVLKGSGGGLVREARLGGLLRHPNLVEVYALERIDGRWACAMERVLGGSLQRERALPPAAVIDVGRQVCAGLQHAHDQIGLVHLDIKPSNLLLDGTTVKIADLGVARAHGFGGEGRVRGTPVYMSPEQADGRPVDARSDLWSLGVCLYELATGHRPAVDTGAGDTWSTVDGAEIDAPWIPAVDAVPWLSPVLARCLAPDPEDRFPSAEVLGAALEALRMEGPGLADALGLATPAPVPRRSGSGTGSATGTLTRRAPTETNLGPELDAFVGRQEELGRLDREVRDASLVTLKGPGGGGKTRLARRFGERWRARTGYQGWFIDLAAARSRFDVLSAVADTLKVEIGAASEHALAHRIGHALAGRGGVLLILDNFEQVLDCADLPAGWASADPSVRVLVTSREPLRVDGERVVELAPLPEDEAVALLVARARDRGRDIAGDPVLGELARRLDGLPLALELAAGRMALLSPAQVLDRLEQRLRLLGGGSRGGRQATLRATLEWSWELLGDEERLALAQLSVFRGGFTVDLAEQVLEVPGAPWALDLLGALADRSLVVVRPGPDGGRFDLLESVRVFAAERLGEGAAGAEQRHGRAMTAFHRSRDDLDSFSLAGFDRVRVELDNLVVACERAAGRGDGPVAVHTLVAAADVLELRGPYRALAVLADSVAGLELDRRARALVTLIQARVQRRLGRARDALAGLAEARRTFAELGEIRFEADALNLHGNILRQGGDVAGAVELLSASEELFASIGDERSRAMVWGNLGACHYDRGELDEARTQYQRALHARRALGDRRGEGHLLGSLAAVEQISGRTGEARRLYRDALRLHRDLGDRRSEALSLGNLGVLEMDGGAHDKAERRWLDALEIRRSIGERAGVGTLLGYLAMLHLYQGELDRSEAAARETLAILREAGRERMALSMVMHLGGIALLRGRLASARSSLMEAREGFVALGDRIGLGMAAVQWGQLCRKEGDFAEARRAFEAAVEAVSGRHVPSEAAARAWLGLALAEAGERDGAVDELDRAQVLLRAGQYTRGLGDVLALRALALGDREALAEARASAPVPGSPSALLLAEVEAAFAG